MNIVSSQDGQENTLVVTTTDKMMASTRWMISRDKKPYYLDGSIRSGEQNIDADIAALSSFEKVDAKLNELGDDWEFGFALGFDGHGYWQGIDFDKVEENELVELANHLPGYVEFSRSGTGAHAYGYGPRPFKTLGSNGSGIEAYSTSQFFVVTRNTIRDAPLTDLAPFVEGVLTPMHKRRRLSGSEGDSGPVDITTIEDIRNALTFGDADDRSEWIANLHALKSLGPQGYGLAVEYSKRSPKFDGADFERVWESLNPTDTSYKAILKKAQDAGWKNPGKGWGLAGHTVDMSAFGSQRFKLLNSAAIRAVSPMEWALKGVIVARGSVVLFGPSASAKSFLVFDLLAAIAEGKPFFGLRTVQRYVVYMALEGRSGVRGRVLAWETVNGRPLPENFAVILDQFDLKSPADVAELASRLPKGCVIAIDTLARAGDDDENDAKQRALVINGMMQLQLLIDGLVIAVAHTGKEEDKGLRGHKKLFDALDGAIAVSRNGDRRMWRADKVKDGQDGISRRFRLAIIPIGTDDDGDEITSCVIAPEHGTFTGTPTKPLSAGMIAGLTAFRVAAGKFGKLDDNGDFVGLHIEAWREEFYRTSTAENAETKRRTFNRTRETLVEIGELSVDNDHYSIAGPNSIVSNAAIAAQINAGTPGHDRDKGGTCPAS